MNKKAGLHEFVEGMEMTVLSSEDQVLLDGMVGTSGSINGNCGSDDHNTNCPCPNNVAGCGK